MKEDYASLHLTLIVDIQTLLIQLDKTLVNNQFTHI